MEMIRNFELSKEYLDSVRYAIEQGDSAFILETMEGVNEADIALLLEELDTEEAQYVIRALDSETSAGVIKEIDSDVRGRFLRNFEPTEVAPFIDEMDSDDAVDLLNELDVKRREEVIANLTDSEQAAYIHDLMRYEDDCAGGLMAKEFIKANQNWTVVQCIEEIRRQAENVEKIYSIYVVSDDDVLLGRVSLKRIILSSSHTKIADIYEPELISVPTYMDEEEVADIMQKYNLEAVPVVNVHGKLVGRITIDDIIDVITEQAEQDMQIMAGISADVEETDGVWDLTKARIPWLIVGIVGGLIGAKFIGLFEGDIMVIPALAFFIPLITATGGNVGIQSSSIIVQSLANKSVLDDSYAKRFAKVLFVALLNGLVLGLIVFFTVVFLYGDSAEIGLVVSIALFSVVLLASFMGTITPLILDKFGVNPALASGPFITTANDLIGIAVYFLIATLLLNI